MRFTHSIGKLLLAVLLILWGLMYFIPALSGIMVALAILAIVAGIFLLIDR
jgi:hypothetical protein